MANYLARVELHAASYDDYEELHDSTSVAFHQPEAQAD
jgi:hypothetical protein